MSKVNILGVYVDDIKKGDLERAIVDCVNKKRKEIFAYANVHAINIARHDSVFRDFLNGAHLVYCDGEGLRLGARILGFELPRRTVLTRWIWDLGGLFQEKGISVFLLGGSIEGVGVSANQLCARYPRLKLVGYHHGYFDSSEQTNSDVIDMINRASPNVLFVGFGMPRQEIWIRQNFDQLMVNAFIPCGGMFDYLSGVVRVSPSWMSEHGMEWLHRLIQDPVRLWRRYVWGNPVFMFNIFRESLKKGKRQ
jgi:N-acetylglucosaminyldiphosphoundecaprenol N-acetyl-beta-D-mannosaminyltransferase